LAKHLGGILIGYFHSDGS